MEWCEREGGAGYELIRNYHANPDNELFGTMMSKAPKMTNDFYWCAFQELGTERQIGMSIGPIPLSKIWEWAHHMDLTHSEARALAYVINQLDSAYLRCVAEKSKSSR